MKQAAMVDPEFTAIREKSVQWLKRLELLGLVELSVEKVNFKIREIVVPRVSTCRLGDRT
jgi:hypothetical protein